MSTLFFEDTVAFRTDPHITGTVEQTWSEIDPEPNEALSNCYVHKSLPSRVRKIWFTEGRLSTGYVIVTFMQPYDGHCLVSEQSLLLIDRSLAAGDFVKKSPSDAQSGTVISTSITCSLQPLCSEKEYFQRHQRPILGHYPSIGPHASKQGSHHEESNNPTDAKLSPPIQVPAGELTHWHNYREQDFIIYKNWVGQVKSIYDEVTIRLGNGSVVVLEDSEELEEPYYIQGTSSHELVERLDRAGFYKHHPRRYATGIGKPQAYPADAYHPGQDVQTKKGNLRRGRWKFGAYDPSLTPRGIVVDVRCVQLEVKWLYPNQFVQFGEQAVPPVNLLDADELNSAKVRVYDRSRVPKHRYVDKFLNASYGPDTGFGHRVRFRDPAGAAVKYGFTPVDPEILGPGPEYTGPSGGGAHLLDPSERPTSHSFKRIPRAATQGFDMNVLQVTATSTNAMVRWQDCTYTMEHSTQLYPYLNIDENDVWPGDKISFKPDEEQLDANNPSAIRVHKAGVVQSVDAVGRIASVRWYDGAQIDIEADNDDMTTWQFSGLWYGKLGTETSEVPLYDIAAYPTINMNRGDGAIVLPELHLPVSVGSRTSRLLSAGIGRAFGLLGIPASQSSGTNPRASDDSPSSGPLPASNFDELGSENIDWCGEIIDFCLDGDVTVRLGAAAEVRDIKVPPGRILVVGLEDVDDDSDYTDEDDEDLSDEMSVDEIDTDRDSDEASVDPIDVSVEYDGEKPADADNDGIWTTDEEDDQEFDLENAQVDGALPSGNDHDFESRLESRVGTAIHFASYTSMPVSFSVLDGTPTDHHFLNTPRNLNASVMRRIMKENGILRRSLPDGVFVRAWESRLDLLRVLIIGPHGTPYEFAPFVVDLQFGPDFPSSPPDTFFHSWTGNLGRINPNLYEDGKICLSLLGTWNADEKHESWSAKHSTVLQIIVSLMGLVLVKEPYYNEAGFDVLVGSADSRIPSQLYTEKVYVLSKAFIKTALTSPLQGLDGIIKWLYLTSPEASPRLLRRVVEDSEALLPETSTANVVDEVRSLRDEPTLGPTRLSAGALILLRRNLVWLKDYLEHDQEQK